MDRKTTDSWCPEQEATAETPDTSPVAPPPLTFKLGGETHLSETKAAG